RGLVMTTALNKEIKMHGPFHAAPSAPSVAQQGVELAGALERLQIVIAPNVRLTDENLRHGHLPVGALDHFIAQFPVAADIEFLECNALALEQRFRSGAVGAVAGGVNFDGGHLNC